MAILLKHADLAALDRTLKSAFIGAYEGGGYAPRNVELRG